MANSRPTNYGRQLPKLAASELTHPITGVERQSGANSKLVGLGGNKWPTRTSFRRTTKANWKFSVGVGEQLNWCCCCCYFEWLSPWKRRLRHNIAIIFLLCDCFAPRNGSPSGSWRAFRRSSSSSTPRATRGLRRARSESFRPGKNKRIPRNIGTRPCWRENCSCIGKETFARALPPLSPLFQLSALNWLLC